MAFIIFFLKLDETFPIANHFHAYRLFNYQKLACKRRTSELFVNRSL
jgi:hypothetical protein